MVNLYASHVRRMLLPPGVPAALESGAQSDTQAHRAKTDTALATVLSTATFAAAAFHWAPHPWAAAVLAPLLVLVTVVDLEHQLILDETVLAGIVTGTILSITGYSVPVASAFGGLLLNAGLMVLVAMASPGSMGGGDVKFTAVTGVFLGPWFGLLSLFFGFILAAVAGMALLVTRRKRRRDAIPFGPFLAGGTYIAAVWGPVILRLYISLALKK